MNPLEHHEDHPNIVIPSIAEIITYISGSVFVLIVLNANRVIKYYAPSDVQNSDYFETTGSRLATYLDTKLLPAVVTAAVWAAVGLVVYLLIWYVTTLISKSYEEEHAAQTFIFPNREQRKLYFMAGIGHVLLRLCGSFFMVVWLALFFAKLLPFTSNMFFKAMAFKSVLGAAGILAAPVIFAVYAYLFTVLCRVIALKPRVFEGS